MKGCLDKRQEPSVIADSCGSREIKVDILELLAKVKETA